MPDAQAQPARTIQPDATARARAVLSTTAARWLVLTETLPNDLLARQPLPGEWSAAECLQHMLDAERLVFPVRIRAILAGQDFVDFDPNKRDAPAVGQDAAQLAAAFARQRAESLALLEQVAADDLPRTARHSKLGLVTLSELISTWAAHDLMHTVQAERSLMQPFLIGCGPWRAAFFRDHDAEVSRQG